MRVIASCALAMGGCGTPRPAASTTVDRDSDFQLTPGGYSHRGWIGIRVQPAPKGQGVLVTATIPRSPASVAGLLPGDILKAADGRALHGPEDFVTLIHALHPGSLLTLRATRGATPLTFALEIENSPDENGVLERMLVGFAAPTLDGLLPLGQGQAPSWEKLRGQVVVLDFWAPWCGVCHLVTDELNRWQARYGEHLTVIGIAAGEVSDIAPHAPRFHMKYPVFADPNERVVRAYEAFAVPLVLVVDASGVVRAVTLGYSSQRLGKMEKLVEELLVAT